MTGLPTASADEQGEEKNAEADSSSSKSKEAEEANEREEEDGGADRSDAVAQGGRRLR